MDHSRHRHQLLSRHPQVRQREERDHVRGVPFAKPNWRLMTRNGCSTGTERVGRLGLPGCAESRERGAARLKRGKLPHSCGSMPFERMNPTTLSRCSELP